MRELEEEQRRRKEEEQKREAETGRTERRVKALEQLVELYRGQKEELENQISSLEGENKKLMEHMVRHSK